MNVYEAYAARAAVFSGAPKLRQVYEQASAAPRRFDAVPPARRARGMPGRRVVHGDEHTFKDMLRVKRTQKDAKPPAFQAHISFLSLLVLALYVVHWSKDFLCYK
ncbi:hypothetical protein ABZP36_015334 [Zizania latifolia]